MQCRSCEHTVTLTFIDLGMSPIANNFLTQKITNNFEYVHNLKTQNTDFKKIFFDIYFIYPRVIMYIKFFL